MNGPAKRPGPVLLPDDLVRKSVSPGESVLVGGRFLCRDDDTFTIADAHGGVRIHGSLSHGLRPHDFITCEVSRDHDGWRLSKLVCLDSASEPRGDGEVARLSSLRARRLAFASRARSEVRSFFEENDFIEVVTPSLVPCPGLDSHVHSLGSISVNGQQRYLITSPELAMKRLLTSGIGRMYQFAHCYRAEENGAWHEPEFTMLEWYRAYASWTETMSDTEELVRRVIGLARASGWSDAPLLGPEPFARMHVSEAFRKFAGETASMQLAERDTDRFFQLLVDRVEPALAELDCPIFLTHFPLCLAALARPCQEEPGTAERYELYFRGVELCNGFGELTNHDEQRARFIMEQQRREAAGEEVYPLDERFLRALQEGMPQCSGNALGIDRLIALASGAANIRDVLAFAADEI